VTPEPADFNSTLSNLMNELTKTGSFLSTDEHGNLISDASVGKICAPA